MPKRGDGASTIRGQLNRIVLVPSLCFLALWLVVAAVGTAQAARLMGAVDQAGEATEVFSGAIEELRGERRQATVQLGAVESGDREEVDTAALEQGRSATDEALAEAANVAAGLGSGGDGEVDRIAGDLEQVPDTVTELRQDVDAAASDREQTLLDYGEVLDLLQETILSLVHSTDGGENLSDAVLAGDLMNAGSEYAEADALLAGVLAAGGMDQQESAHFTYLTASYRNTLADVAGSLHPDLRTDYEEMVGGQEWTRTEDLSREVVTRPLLVESETAAADEPALEPNNAVDISVDEWDENSPSALGELDALALAQTGRTIDLAWSAALLHVSLGMAAGGAVLIAGVATIAVVGRSSRRLTGRLARLRGQILDRDDDLPDIVDRAQRGERVEVQDELPPLDERSGDEIGQVAEAFDSAQLAAVEAAVRQAEIRRGANKAFLGVAFRNQTLVQRQLRLLDEIERDEQDPQALRRLFQLDHLATRGRRYADNLIILAGGQANRRRSRSRPLVDVLRAAIAETEDFGRVRLTSAPRVLMHGQVVADVVHLLAELVENATQFSPTDSTVDVSCSPAVGGLVVEVEDRGLGMSEQDYAKAEHTLAQPSELDVMALPDDPRLGLFVVSRLAERHGVQVKLRPSSYGGTRATALVPESVLEPVEPPAPVPAGSGPPEHSGARQGLGAPAHSGPQPSTAPRTPRVPAGLGSPEAVRRPSDSGPHQPLPAYTRHTPDPWPGPQGAQGSPGRYNPRDPQQVQPHQGYQSPQEPQRPSPTSDGERQPLPVRTPRGRAPAAPQTGLPPDERGPTTPPRETPAPWPHSGPFPTVTEHPGEHRER